MHACGGNALGTIGAIEPSNGFSEKSVNSAGNFSSLWLTQTFPHSFTIRSINQVKRLHLTIANNGLKKADVIVCCGQRGKGTVCFAVGQR